MKKLNTANFRMEFSGYGHYKIFCSYYGKEIYATTTNMEAVDAARSIDERGAITARLNLIAFVRNANKHTVN